MIRNSIDDEVIDITNDIIIHPQDEWVNPPYICDIEESFHYWNPFSVVFLLIFLCVFLLQIHYGFWDLTEELDPSSFTYQYSILPRSSDYTGIFTSMFLHGSIEHIIGNSLFFYILSLVSYRLFGFWRSGFLFVLTGIFAGIASYYFNTLPSLGASGAVFGMFGFLSIFYIYQKKFLTENLKDLSWVMIISAIWQILWWVISPYVDNYAHIWGFLAGLSLGYIYFSFIKKDGFQDEIN